MAVAKFRASSCLDAVSNACLAVQRGNAKQAVKLFRSVGNDAKLLQQESKKYCHRLKQFEVQQENEIENLTRDINELYNAEKKMEVEERNLKTKKAGLEGQKETAQCEVEQAERRYRQARDERDEAAEKCDRAKTWWWVPVYGWIIGIEELIKDNDRKARDAQRDMSRHRNDSDDAEDNIRKANAEIDEVHRDISRSQAKREKLKEQRNHLHDQLSSIKSMSVFFMEAATFWEEVGCVSDSASMKSDHLEKIMKMASKKNTLKILGSNGTKTLMGSFKECWVEIEDMMLSGNVVFAMENLSFE